MAFSRQLSSFLEAGIPVLDALEIVAQQTGIRADAQGHHRHTRSRSTRHQLRRAVDAHPDVFPRSTGPCWRRRSTPETSTTCSSQLADYLERDIAAKRQVKSALTYPIVVLIIAFVGNDRDVGVRAAEVHRSVREPRRGLPLPTRMLIGFTDFMTGYWPLVLARHRARSSVVLFAVIGGARGKGRRDVVAMKLPVIGNLFHLISLERFCRVLSSLSSAGVPLPFAIGLSADSTNNTLFQTHMVARARDTRPRRRSLRAHGRDRPVPDRRPADDPGRRAHRNARQSTRQGRVSYYEREVPSR